VIAYKLFRRRKDGSLGSLFIHRAARIPVGVWLDAEPHRTCGYAFRPGWHCTRKPEAPHLRQSGDRVWYRVELREVQTFERPICQGGAWLLARQMKVLEEVVIVDPKREERDRSRNDLSAGILVKG
jgi:hypothetical protein